MYQSSRGHPNMQYGRKWEEIQKEQLEQESLMRILNCADEILEQSPIAMAGEGLKKNRRFKGECFQRILKENHKEYQGKCPIPEVRFMIFDNGFTLMDVVNRTKYMNIKRRNI